MKILFDHQIFTYQSFGGISRYFLNLHREINKTGEHSSHISSVFTNNIYLLSLYPELKSIYFMQSDSELLIKLGKLIARKINAMETTKHLDFDYDIFHPTYYSTYFINKIKIPFVLTVHDMTHEKLPHYLNDESLTHRKRKLCNLARHIITVSQSTKNDLIELFRIPEEKVSVVYLGGSFSNAETSDDGCPDLPEKYILFIGNRNSYKNFDLMYKALLPLMQKDKELNLLCTGPPFDKMELEQFQNDNVKSRVLHIFADEKQLYTLYKKALCFVFPSKYEGFGIPILEAFSAGCPVILNDTSSLPEVGGNACLYFNDDPVGLQEKIELVISSNEIRHELAIKGLDRARYFSWEKTANDTLAVYNKII